MARNSGLRSERTGRRYAGRPPRTPPPVGRSNSSTTGAVGRVGLRSADACFATIVAPYFATAHQNVGELVVPGRQLAQEALVDEQEIGAAEPRAELAEGAGFARLVDVFDPLARSAVDDFVAVGDDEQGQRFGDVALAGAGRRRDPSFEAVLGKSFGRPLRRRRVRRRSARGGAGTSATCSRDPRTPPRRLRPPSIHREPAGPTETTASRRTADRVRIASARRSELRANAPA